MQTPLIQFAIDLGGHKLIQSLSLVQAALFFIWWGHTQTPWEHCIIPQAVGLQSFDVLHCTCIPNAIHDGEPTKTKKKDLRYVCRN